MNVLVVRDSIDGLARPITRDKRRHAIDVNLSHVQQQLPWRVLPQAHQVVEDVHMRSCGLASCLTFIAHGVTTCSHETPVCASYITRAPAMSPRARWARSRAWMEFAETRLDRTGVSTNVGGAARVGEGIPSVTSRHHDITVGSQCIPRGYQARGRSRASRGGAPPHRPPTLLIPLSPLPPLLAFPL